MGGVRFAGAIVGARWGLSLAVGRRAFRRVSLCVGSGRGGGGGAVLWCWWMQPPIPGMLGSGESPPPPPSTAPSLRPATVPLTPSASLNGICNRQ